MQHVVVDSLHRYKRICPKSWIPFDLLKKL